MQHPQRSFSTATATTATTDDHDSDDSEPHVMLSHEPWLSRILDEAVAFEDVLTEEPRDHNNPNLRVQGDEDQDSKVNDDAAETASVTGLVGRDLGKMDPITRMTSARISQLAVSDWTEPRSPPGASPPMEIKDVSPYFDSDLRSLHSMSSRLSLPTPATSVFSDDVRSEHSRFEENGALPDPTSEEKIELFEQDFGVLTRENEEEKIVMEIDGACFVDVTILGVIHLTTHRLTFHASLLSTLPTEKLIRSGPATVHRANALRKKKVWVELTHDMVTTYKSSAEMDRVKPLRTILLSDVESVRRPCSTTPLVVGLFLSTRKTGSRTSETQSPEPTFTFSFDTSESASEWSRDLSAALFMYRRRRTSTFSLSPDPDPTAAEEDGVRISIPLERIDSISLEAVLSMKSGITLCRLKFTAGVGGGVSGMENLALIVHGATRMPFLEALDRWRSVRRVTSGNANLDKVADLESEMPVVVDFGSLTFVEDDLDIAPSPLEETKKEKATRNQERGVRKAFGIESSEDLWMTRGRLTRRICTFGIFVLTPRFICFWSKSQLCQDTKYRFPTSRLKKAAAIKLLRLGYGIRVEIEGSESMIFTFQTKELREEVLRRLGDLISGSKSLSSVTLPVSPGPQRSSTLSSGISNSTGSHSVAIISPLSRALSAAKAKTFAPEIIPHLPRVINVPPNIEHTIKPRHFVCLTIGSRGDVQPYIALGLGLKKEGHRVTIVTHEEYKTWVEGWGITHRTAGGDPGALMKLSVEHKMFSPAFFKESLGSFRTWLDDLLVDAWEQSRDADVLIESPSAMAGVHIAEALHIPYFRAFTMPWSKTAEYPHAFISPPVDSPSFNSASYVLFDNVLWVATSGQINKWRRKTLGLNNTDMSHLAQDKIPFLYNFSTAVVPKPLDWRDDITVSGYWFLDNPDLNWTPNPKLLAFINKARADGKPLVYIGFGSITVPKPARMTRSIIKAVIKSDVRAIISKGWSSRFAKEDESEIEYPEPCYLQVDSLPHDWLFPQVDAVLHHGGAGTTGASLRAGVPTLIKPWFGDQFFWASRVQKLGAGLRVPALRSSNVAEALRQATTDRIMKEKAAAVGERIRAENGVQNAIHAIYTYLPRAGRSRTEPQPSACCDLPQAK